MMPATSQLLGMNTSCIYLSDMNVNDSDGDAAPSTSNAAPTQTKKRKRLISSDDSDDDIPLSTLREKLVQQREEDGLAIISQMLEEPVWEDVAMASVDTTFKGAIEQAPEHGLSILIIHGTVDQFSPFNLYLYLNLSFVSHS